MPSSQTLPILYYLKSHAFRFRVHYLVADGSCHQQRMHGDTCNSPAARSCHQQTMIIFADAKIYSNNKTHNDRFIFHKSLIIKHLNDLNVVKPGYSRLFHFKSHTGQCSYSLAVVMRNYKRVIGDGPSFASICSQYNSIRSSAAIRTYQRDKLGTFEASSSVVYFFDQRKAACQSVLNLQGPWGEGWVLLKPAHEYYNNDF